MLGRKSRLTLPSPTIAAAARHRYFECADDGCLGGAGLDVEA
jgi:hypothetical protein